MTNRNASAKATQTSTNARRTDTTVRLTRGSALKKKAQRFVQNGQQFFVLVMNGNEIADYTQVPVYHEDTDEGYQREPSEDRAYKAADYVTEKGGKFPTSILVSIREEDLDQMQVTPLQHEDDMSYDPVELNIPHGTPLWLVDGQHRAKALQFAKANVGFESDKFGMSVVLMVSSSEIEEAMLFKTVHEMQRKVPTDLTDRILMKEVKAGRTDPSKLWDAGNRTKYREVITVRLTRHLDTDAESPWRGKLRPPNSRSREAEAEEAGEEVGWTTVSERGMTTSLRPYVKKYETLPTDLLEEILIAYWKAVQIVTPDAWKDPEGHRYLLKKSTGIQVLNTFLPTAYQYAMMQGGPTPKVFARILESAGVHEDFFKSDGDLKGVLGIGGFKAKVDLMEGRLRNLAAAGKLHG